MIYDSEFEIERELILKNLKANQKLNLERDSFFQNLVDAKYSYNFNWMGVPIIQMPGDLIVFQEIVNKVRPDVIVECGVARGGSILFWSSMLELFHKVGIVIGVDIEIKTHTQEAIKDSMFKHRIKLIEGDSTDVSTLNKVKSLIPKDKKVMIVLDSNHTESHVLKELDLYSQLVSTGSYLIVLDTVIEKLKPEKNRPWGPGDNPMTAVEKFMKDKSNVFKQDFDLEYKSYLTVAPNGFYERIK